MEFEHITQQLDEMLHVGESMDINARRIVIGGRRAVLYFLQGFLRGIMIQYATREIR